MKPLTGSAWLSVSHAYVQQGTGSLGGSQGSAGVVSSEAHPGGLRYGQSLSCFLTGLCGWPYSATSLEASPIPCPQSEFSMCLCVADNVGERELWFASYLSLVTV